MKVLQPCAECGGTDFRIVPVSVGTSSAHLLPLPGPGIFWRSGRLDLCICVQCGLVRWFVPPDLLPAVRDTYPPVPHDESRTEPL
jgi:hypothetical protein